MMISSSLDLGCGLRVGWVRGEGENQCGINIAVS